MESNKTASAVEGSDLLFLEELCFHGLRTFAFGSQSVCFDQQPKHGDTSTCIWPSAIRLAYLIFEDKETIVKSLELDGTSKPRVLELGCGVFPLVSIACAYSGMEVIATDLSHVVEQARLHSSLPSIEYAELDWFKRIVPATFSQLDLIVAADVIYQSVRHEDLASTLKMLLERAKPTAYALVCWQLRDRQCEQAFLNLLRSNGMAYFLVSKSRRPRSNPDLPTEDHIKYTRVIKIILDDPPK